MPCTRVEKKIQFIRGSHLLGEFSPQDNKYSIETKGGYKDIYREVVSKACDEDILTWDLEVSLEY